MSAHSGLRLKHLALQFLYCIVVFSISVSGAPLPQKPVFFAVEQRVGRVSISHVVDLDGTALYSIPFLGPTASRYAGLKLDALGEAFLLVDDPESPGLFQGHLDSASSIPVFDVFWPLPRLPGGGHYTSLALLPDFKAVLLSNVASSNRVQIFDLADLRAPKATTVVVANEHLLSLDSVFGSSSQLFALRLGPDNLASVGIFDSVQSSLFNLTSSAATQQWDVSTSCSEIESLLVASVLVEEDNQGRSRMKLFFNSSAVATVDLKSSRPVIGSFVCPSQHRERTIVHGRQHRLMVRMTSSGASSGSQGGSTAGSVATSSSSGVSFGASSGSTLGSSSFGSSSSGSSSIGSGAGTVSSSVSGSSSGSYSSDGSSYSTTASAYSTTGSAYSTTGSDYSTTGSDYSTTGSSYSTTGSDYSTTGSDYSTTGSDYSTTGSDYSTTGSDYSTTGSDYSTTGSDYSTSGGTGSGSENNYYGSDYYYIGLNQDFPDECTQLQSAECDQLVEAECETAEDCEIAEQEFEIDADQDFEVILGAGRDQSSVLPIGRIRIFRGTFENGTRVTIAPARAVEEVDEEEPELSRFNTCKVESSSKQRSTSFEISARDRDGRRIDTSRLRNPVEFELTAVLRPGDNAEDLCLGFSENGASNRRCVNSDRNRRSIVARNSTVSLTESSTHWTTFAVLLQQQDTECNSLWIQTLGVLAGWLALLILLTLVLRYWPPATRFFFGEEGYQVDKYRRTNSRLGSASRQEGP